MEDYCAYVHICIYNLCVYMYIYLCKFQMLSRYPNHAPSDNPYLIPPLPASMSMCLCRPTHFHLQGNYFTNPHYNKNNLFPPLPFHMYSTVMLTLFLIFILLIAILKHVAD